MGLAQLTLPKKLVDTVENKHSSSHVPFLSIYLSVFDFKLKFPILSIRMAPKHTPT